MYSVWTVVYEISKPETIPKWLEYVPNKVKVLIVPVLRDTMGRSIKDSPYTVANPINILTGDNIVSFEKDMRRLLPGDTEPRVVDRCSECIEN